MTPGSAFARLLREPQRFRFDAGVRLLQHAARTGDPAEGVQFRSVPGMAFPGSDITAVQAAEGGRAARMSTPVIGLTGATGTMPRYYTEILAQSLRNRSRAMHDFIDLLSTRMIAHFARAGTKYRMHRVVETHALSNPAMLPVAGSAASSGPIDPIAAILLSLSGYGTPHLRERLGAGVDPLLHYAGLFAAWPRSADRLESMMSDWLGRPVKVVQFAGAWLALPPDQRTRLPVGRRAGQFTRLGRDAAIGVRAWDLQARVVLRLGPLDIHAFSALLPDRRPLHRLVGLVRAFLGQETGFAVNPVLGRDAVPILQLGVGEPGPRLGWTTWLPAHGFGRTGDADEAMFEAEIVEATRPPEGRA